MIDGSLTFDTKIDTKGFTTGTNTIETQAKGLTNTFSKLGGIIAAAFAVDAIVKFSSHAISLASDLQEVQNVVDVSFSEMTYKMEQFADTAIETFGLSQLEAKRTGSSFMAMGKGMNFATDTASDMALSLTGLSADMASFYNVSHSESQTALSAIYTGETETLKRYGILITEVNLEEYARTQGITKSINAMTQQEKVMLRYNYIMGVTKLAQGDFARTSDSWANQTRVLNEVWKEFLITLGQVLIPVLIKTIPYIIAFIRIMDDAVRSMALFFGIDMVKNTPITSGIDDTVNGLGEVTTGAKKAKKEIQKLAGFDELNILAKNNVDEDISDIGSVGGSGAISDIGDIDSLIPDIGSNDIFAESDRIYEDMKHNLQEFGEFVQDVMPVVKTVGGAMVAMWAVNKLLKFIKVLKGLKIIKGISKLWSAFMIPFDEVFSSGAGKLKATSAGVKGLKKALSPLAKLMITIGAAVGSFVFAKDMFEDVAEGTRSWESALALTVPLVGGLAVVVGLLVSPIAGIGVAIAGVVGAIIGYNDGVENMAKISISDFYNDGDTNINDIVDDFQDLSTAITESEDKYLANAEQLDTTQEHLTGVSDEIDILIGKASTMGTTTPEEVAKLKNAFKELADASTTYIKQSTDNLIDFYIANKGALEAQGANVQGMVSILSEGSEQTVQDISSMYDELDTLSGKTDETSLVRIDELTTQILNYTGAVDESKAIIEQLSTKMNDYGKISIIDAETAENSLTNMALIADETITKLSEAKDEAIETIDTLKLNPTDRNLLIEETKAMFEYKENEIMEILSPAFKNVYSQVELASLKATAEATGTRAKGVNPWLDFWNETLFGNSVESTIEKKAVELGGFSVDEILNGVKEKLLEKDGKVDIVDMLLGTSESSGGRSHGGGGTSFGEEIGKDIIDGEVDGIEDNTYLAENAMTQSSTDVIGKAETEYDIHSPSKVFTGIGKNLMLGLANGIKDNSAIAMKNLQTVIDGMLKQLDSFEIQRQISLSKAFTTSTIDPQTGEKRYISKPQFPIPRLATGTVVPANAGEFMAILGDNKRETEIVSPLSTMKQAVAEVLLSMQGGATQGGNITIPIYLGNELIEEIIVTAEQRRLTRSNGR